MLSYLRAAALARRLDLELLSCGVCLPCLTFVAFPLDEGDEREARRVARRMTRELWLDGLEGPALEALERARRTGDPDAAEAIADTRVRGPGASLVKALVWHLAEDMVVDMRARSRSRARSTNRQRCRTGST